MQCLSWIYYQYTRIVNEMIAEKYSYTHVPRPIDEEEKKKKNCMSYKSNLNVLCIRFLQYFHFRSSTLIPFLIVLSILLFIQFHFSLIFPFCLPLFFHLNIGALSNSLTFAQISHLILHISAFPLCSSQFSLNKETCECVYFPSLLFPVHIVFCFSFVLSVSKQERSIHCVFIFLYFYRFSLKMYEYTNFGTIRSKQTWKKNVGHASNMPVDGHTN